MTSTTLTKITTRVVVNGEDVYDQTTQTTATTKRQPRGKRLADKYIEKTKIDENAVAKRTRKNRNTKLTTTSSTTLETCVICADEAKQFVKCVFCDFETCKSCIIRYIVDDTVQAKCMNCSKAFTREILYNYFGRTFMATVYRDKRTRDVYEIEKALLPDAQNALTELRAQQERDKDISTLNLIASNSYQALKLVEHLITSTTSIHLADSGHLTVVADVLTLVKRTAEQRLRNIEIDEPDVIDIVQVVAPKALYKCGQNACNGFVTNTEHKCGVCATSFCRKCREPVYDQINGGKRVHVCDEGTVETVRLLQQDTKACPKCAVAIHKIHGCDQMYCVECHTAFSWNTLEIVNGPIHNPHYFEYMRRNNRLERNPNDVPCGGVPHINTIPVRFRQKDNVEQFVRFLSHVQEVEIPKCAVTSDEKKMKLRFAFLEGTTTETKFKATVQRNDKADSKQTEIRQVLSTLVLVGSDLLRNTQAVEREMNASSTKQATRLFIAGYDEYVKGVVELINHVNQSFVTISQIFTGIVPQVKTKLINKQEPFHDDHTFVLTKYRV